MESEEREQIPWSSLVAEPDRVLDRRWLTAAVLVGVVAIVGVAFSLRDRGQPPAPSDDAIETSAPSVNAIEPSPSMVVTEDQLTADPALAHGPDDLLVIAARAEWFTMDFFTVDGSTETMRSIRAALAHDLRAVPLPHDELGPQTFVEWARTVQIDHVGGDAYQVTVVFRTIRASDTGFDRDPVRAVSFEVATSEGKVAVARMPTPVDVDAIMMVPMP